MRAVAEYRQNGCESCLVEFPPLKHNSDCEGHPGGCGYRLSFEYIIRHDFFVSEAFSWGQSVSD